jgi:hypothetical protein
MREATPGVVVSHDGPGLSRENFMVRVLPVFHRITQVKLFVSLLPEPPVRKGWLQPLRRRLLLPGADVSVPQVTGDVFDAAPASAVLGRKTPTAAAITRAAKRAENRVQNTSTTPSSDEARIKA